MSKICLTPRVSGIGGMVSFRDKLTSGLREKGIEVTQDLGEDHIDAVLVIGGTRQLGQLRSVRRRGVRIIQRLNGINWIHRKRNTGLRHYLRSEYGNWNLRIIRNRLVDGVIYQSEFARSWWHRKYAPSGKPEHVIHNAVDLDQFIPFHDQNPPADRYRILVIEGSLLGGYDIGLESALGLAELLENSSDLEEKKPVELMVVGKVSQPVQAKYARRAGVKILWKGTVPHTEIPMIDNRAHLLFSSDINAACPNSVIEALGCGLPVLAYDTGALPELVTQGAGEIVPYGGNPWKLEPPDISKLVDGAVRILKDQPVYRENARALAVSKFGLDQMVDAYVEILLG